LKWSGSRAITTWDYQRDVAPGRRARLSAGEWEYAGLRHLAIHGHQFDGFAVNSVSLSSLGTTLLALQKLDLKGNPMSRLIDRWNTRFLRMSPKVAVARSSMRACIMDRF
jgi:hypothetical protein